MSSSGNLRVKANRVCISLLNRCLTAHCIDESKQEDWIGQARKALEHSVSFPIVVNPGIGSTSTEASSSLVSSKKPRQDEHNEVCEVCEKGGELLCCDTCNLVFHLDCLRPKLSVVPKGRWSCAHCIVDGLANGDASIAKQGIRSMSRLACGVDSGDEEEVTPPASEGRLSRAGEITIVRSGKRYIVRKTSRSQIVELGRYDTLEKALSSLAVSAVEDQELWCMFCLDDPTLKICAFCGCRSCFGKHDTEDLLLCDSCNQESHTYCLNPPLLEIPSSNWFCAPCIKSGFHVDVGSGYGDDDVSVGSGGGGGGEDGRVGGGAGKKDKRKKSGGLALGRGRGRPPGTGKKSKDSISGTHTDSLPGAYADGTVEAVGVDAVLAIVSTTSKQQREMGKTQLLLLDQLREWAPLGDLNLVLSSLIAAKEQIRAAQT